MTTFLGQKLLIRFTVLVFRKHLSVCECASFPFGFEGGMLDLILLVPFIIAFLFTYLMGFYLSFAV